MKREWYKEAQVSTQGGSRVPYEALAKARAELLASPDERRRHLDLVKLLAQNGSIDDLDDEVGKWSRRDPQDEAAITARADVLARRGEREKSLHVLSGILASPMLSAADAGVASGNLATAFERAGFDKEACALRIATAELKAKDAEALAAAALCERKTGHARSAERLLTELPAGVSRETIVKKIAALDVADPSRTDRATGDIVVDASWDGDADVDITLIDPLGNRLAWASRASGVRVVDPRSRRHEVLGVKAAPMGTYSVELTRVGDGSRTVRGIVRVTAFGVTKSTDFSVSGTRGTPATVDVKWKSRLVPVDPGIDRRRMME